MAKIANLLSCVLSTYLYGAFDCMFLSCHVPVSEWIHTLYLPECQGTPCSKQARNLELMWLQLNSNLEPLSLSEFEREFERGLRERDRVRENSRENSRESSREFGSSREFERESSREFERGSSRKRERERERERERAD